MNIAVIGTGALGGYYGARLAHNSNEVHFLLHSDYEYVSKHGLTVESIEGDFSIASPNIYNSIEAMPQCELVMIATKSTSNSIIFPQLKSLLKSNSIILLMQNGLGTEEKLQELYPSNTVIGGLAFLCSNKIGPGHIKHLDSGKIKIANHSGTLETLHTIAELLHDSGIIITELDNLPLARWQKLVWNIPFNGLSVVLDSSTDIITAHPEAYNLAHDIMKEVIAGAHACGVDIKDNFADKMLAYTKSMTPYEPSMRLDFLNKRPMELETIYAEPLRQAFKNGYKMVKTEMLLQQLQFIESRY